MHINKREKIVKSDRTNFKHMFKSPNAKFYFGGDNNEDFKCIIPIHGHITFFDDRDRNKLGIKLKNGNLIDKNDNYRAMNGKNKTVEYRVLKPSKDSNVISKRVNFKEKEIFYQQYKNGDIAFCRKQIWEVIAILQPPKVYNDKGEYTTIKQMIEKTDNGMFHKVIIDSIWFKAQNKVYFDDPFTVTTTAQFDAGVKNQVETNTDWVDIPEDELHLEYGDIFSEDFEGVNGTNLDAYDPNWAVVLGGAGTCKINNEQSYSGNMSVKASVGIAATQFRRPVLFVTGTEDFISYFRCNVTVATPNRFTTQTLLFPAVAASIRFETAYDIFYDDNLGGHDSGLNYVEDTWYRIRITHNPGAGTYSAWILGGAFTTETNICNNVTYSGGGVGIPDTILYDRTTVGAERAEYWIDNVKVGNYVASGDWLSATQTLLFDNLLDTKVKYYDCDANMYIDKIQWLVGAVVKAEYDVDINDDTASPFVITEGMLTLGTFKDVDDDFTVKVFLVGDGTDTPKIQKLSGRFEGSAEFGQVNCEIKFNGLYPGTTGPWLDSGFGQRRMIVVDSEYVTGTKTDFVVRVHLSGNCGQKNQDLTEIFDEVGANYLKIAITTADMVTQCYIEVEKWDSGGEDAELWLKVPQIGDISDSYLWCYFDNDHANNTSYVGLPGSVVAENVWKSKFMMVHHMNDNPDVSNITDSTSNDNDGVKFAANEPIEAAGRIAECQDFDRSNDLINCGNDASLDITDKITIECWFKSALSANNRFYTIVSKGSLAAGTRSYMLYLGRNDGNGGSLLAFSKSSDGNGFDGDAYTNWGDILPNTWYHVFATYDGTDMHMWVNSVLAANENSPGTAIKSVVNDLEIGRAGVSDRYYEDFVDEVRISNSVPATLYLTEALMWIEYNSQIDNLIYWGATETYLSLSTYTNNELSHQIQIESLQINDNQNRSPTCDIQVAATVTAKNITRGDTVEVIREDAVHCFYGRIEKISQSAGQHSISFSCEGMMYFCNVPINHKFYTPDDIGGVGGFHNLVAVPFPGGTTQFNDDDLRTPVCGVEALHTTEKNFNVKKDHSVLLNPIVTTINANPNDLTFPFTAKGGSPASQILKIACQWERPVGSGNLGILALEIVDDLNGVPNLASVIAQIIVDDNWLVGKGINIGGGPVIFVLDKTDFQPPNGVITDGRNNIDLQAGQRYWVVLRLEELAGDAGIIIEWISGNSAQMDDKWNIRTFNTQGGGGPEWHAWLQPTAAGGIYGPYQPANAVDYEFWVGAIPWFEIEFKSDWIPLKHGKDYKIIQGSTDVEFGADFNTSNVDSISFDNYTRENGGNYSVVRMSYSYGPDAISLENCFLLIARDYMRDIVDKVDVDVSSIWELNDWLINGQTALQTLQMLCSVDRVSMRIFKDIDLVVNRIVFEVKDKMITSDYTDYSTNEQEYRTFRALDTRTDLKLLGESTKIVSASKVYDEHNRINRVIVVGSDEIIAARTDWDEIQTQHPGVIRATTVSSDIVNTKAYAFDIADKIIEDYANAPFEGDIEIVDGRYDSYKIFQHTNGLVRVVIDELDVDDWFEIDSISTRWDGGNNWTNSIKIGSSSGRFKLPGHEGFKRRPFGLLMGKNPVHKLTRTHVRGGEFGGWESLAFENLFAAGSKGYRTSSKSPGNNIEEEDEVVETYEPNSIMVYRDYTDPGGNVYMDIGNSDANPALDAIQSSIINFGGNAQRILCERYTNTDLGITTFFTIIDKENIGMNEETDFPETIKEVALYDAATAGNAITRAVFKQLGAGTEGYIRDALANNQVMHHFVKFTSDNRLYIFFDLDEA